MEFVLDRAMELKEFQQNSDDNPFCQGNSDNFECDICETLFQTLSALKSHSLLHDPSDRILCLQCNHESLTLKQHRAHSVECLSNSLSESKFSSTENLSENDYIETDEREEIKKRGRKKIKRKTYAKPLRKEIKPPRGKSCLCPECGKLCSSAFMLSQHLPLHYSQPVTCDICQKSLKTKKILAEHLKTHWKTEDGTRVAQAICPHCGLELAQKGSLQRHILLVHQKHLLQKKDPPRSCKICYVLLPTTTRYYSHMRQHRAATMCFTCDICSRAFNKKHNLLRHMYLLHERKGDNSSSIPRVTCQFCYKPFKEMKNLLRHYKKIHMYDGTNHTYVGDKPVHYNETDPVYIEDKTSVDTYYVVKIEGSSTAVL